jgi:hypothetical protein
MSLSATQLVSPLKEGPEGTMLYLVQQSAGQSLEMFALVSAEGKLRPVVGCLLFCNSGRQLLSQFPREFLVGVTQWSREAMSSQPSFGFLLKF